MKTLLLKTIFLLLTVLSMVITSCSNEINSNITEINYGTSFGECFGYCKHQLTLKPDSEIYNCSGWNEQFVPLTFKGNLSAIAWDSARVNLNIKAFFDLPGVIGCPDCADGGAEWLEIKLVNGDIHKVTYEYNNEPVLLKTYILKFREKLSKNECK